ncbi:MFS transporter [Sphingopyxis sp. BSN-002]|uniref:MFS transporter n=1 Tax=Sphingopyxis sp. BSN-002 TaxID=2911495 RepID=UPI001EDB9332|nr:MFS transporter [Sphingopyxis sp. BSN-002]UKK84070.1 MFS transporter [Sphingopyxis sp. BSN-002]
MATQPIGTRVSGARLSWVVGLIALSVLLNYVDRGAIGVAAPLMKEELQLSATGFGLAVSAFFWVYAPACLLVGWLCDRFCVYRIFAAGVAIWALSTALTGFVGGLVSLIILRLFLGLGESIAFPGSTKIFAAEVPAERRGIANAVVAAALAFGPAAGVLAGGAILGEWGWRPVFWIFGAVTLLWLIPWMIASAPMRARGLAAPAAGQVSIGRLIRLPTLWKMSIVHFLSNYGFYFLLAWLPLYLVNTRGYSIGEMTILTTLSFTTQGVVALAGGWLSDTMVARGANEGEVRRWLMVAGQVGLGAAIAGIGVADSYAMLAFWLAVAGFGTGLLSTNLFAVGQIFAGPRAAGSWMGAQNALGNISGIVGPIVTGLIVDYLGGYAYAFASAAGLSLLGALLWWKMIPEIRPLDL